MSLTQSPLRICLPPPSLICSSINGCDACPSSGTYSGSPFPCVSSLVNLTSHILKEAGVSWALRHILQTLHSGRHHPSIFLHYANRPALAPSVKFGLVLSLESQHRAAVYSVTITFVFVFHPQVEWKLLEINYYQGSTSWQRTQLLSSWGVCMS